VDRQSFKQEDNVYSSVKVQINKLNVYLQCKLNYDVCYVLYGCETWSLTLREEHRLRVFENRVLRRMFRPKRDEVT
jgi:hypothetical protein